MQKESKKRILIVEDDADISMIEEAYLSAAGFETEIITDGIEAEKKLLEQTDSRQYDLILLDLMLPGKSGYDICKHVRDKVEQPILMVTARMESLDKIRGLGCGADDYIQKPFDPAELVARVHANIRQYERLRDRFLAQTASDKPEEIVIGDLKIIPDSFKVYKGEKELKMPGREFELLRFLAQNPNIVFSREQLFEKIWGYDYVGDNATVMVHINRIREKIEDDSKNPKILETIWGVGYRLNR